MLFLEGRCTDDACPLVHVDASSERGTRILTGLAKRRAAGASAATKATENDSTRAAGDSAAAAPAVPSLADAASQARVEREFVVDVYDAIAAHFSATRYKPWPLVEQFLLDQPCGSILGDVGCGNGKYAPVLKGIAPLLGCDRSAGLLAEARALHSAQAELVLADSLCLPYRDGSFDALICVAVIHHFASDERRLTALAELVRVLRPGGQALVTVWALEQEKRKYSAQDVFVPWHSSTGAVHHRYYHLFCVGELERLAAQLADARVVRSAYDCENWYAVIERVR